MSVLKQDPGLNHGTTWLLGIHEWYEIENPKRSEKNTMRGFYYMALGTEERTT